MVIRGRPYAFQSGRGTASAGPATALGRILSARLRPRQGSPTISRPAAKPAENGLSLARQMAEKKGAIVPFVRIVGALESLGKMIIQPEGRFVKYLVALTAVVAVSICSCGCRMCADPYDYCQPTYTGECGQQCCPTYRAGSVLTPNCGGCEQCGHVAGGSGCPDCQGTPTEGPIYEGEMIEPAPAVPLKPVPQYSDQSSTKTPQYQAKPVSYESPTTARTRRIPNAGAPVRTM